MKLFRLPKTLVFLITISIILAGISIYPVLGASNHKDTTFNFNFSGLNYEQTTPWRIKYNTTSAYMKCTNLIGTRDFYSCIPQAKYYDQYGNYITEKNVTVRTYVFYKGTEQYVQNWAWEHAPSNAETAYLRLYASVRYYENIQANGLWSPDSV